MRATSQALPLAALAGLAALALAPAAAANPSARVYYDSDGDGRLRSESDAATQRIPDFSHAGYRGGGVDLPEVASAIVVDGPVAGDNTAALQAAIDAAAELPVGADGFRGAVVLGPGRYEITGSLRIHSDGIVLRGAGDGADPAENTVITRIGGAENPVILIGGAGNNRWKNELPGSRSEITSSFVQVGSRAFEVADPGLYEVGDNIIVFHPCTDAWLATKDYGATGSERPWAVGSFPLVFNRVITRIDGAMIHIDAPVFDNLDRDLAHSSIYRLDRQGIVSRVGIENLRVEIASDLVMHAISFTHVDDGFARDLTVRDFLLGGIHMTTAKHLTIRGVRAIDPKGPTIGGRKYNFMAASAQLILVEDGFARGGRHSYASNGTSYDSGIVFLRGISDGSLAASEGHHRWSMGLLYDGHRETNVVSNGVLLGLYNRGSYGTGHGWATAHSVAWNCDLAGGKGVIQRPPGADNYAIGCKGQISGDGPFKHPTGTLESLGQAVSPTSLYEAQLSDRLDHPPLPPTPPPGSRWEAIAPVADAFVRGGPYADENYGDAARLTVKAGNPEFTREAYLRFDISDAPAHTAAHLYLRQPGLGIGGMRFAIARVDGAWEEDTITFHNRPIADVPFAWWWPEQADPSLIDITQAVAEAAEAGTTLDLVIAATAHYGGRGSASFGAREATETELRPALLYTVVDEGEGTTGGESESDSGDASSSGDSGDSGDSSETSAGSGDATASAGSESGVGSATASGGADDPSEPGDPAASGCACATTSPTDPRGAGRLGLLLGIFGVLRGRRRRPA